MKPRFSCHFATSAMALVLTSSIPSAHAADNESASNPMGTWKVTQYSGTNAQVRPAEYTLKLKLEGGVLSGTLGNVSVVNGKSLAHEWVTKAKVQGNELSFTVTHPPVAGNGPNSTSTYKGVMSADTIKGTVQTEWMGETHTRDWKATRLKP